VGTKGSSNSSVNCHHLVPTDQILCSVVCTCDVPCLHACGCSSGAISLSPRTGTTPVRLNIKPCLLILGSTLITPRAYFYWNFFYIYLFDLTDLGSTRARVHRTDLGRTWAGTPDAAVSPSAAVVVGWRPLPCLPSTFCCFSGSPLSHSLLPISHFFLDSTINHGYGVP
jgi:hypothetical protein